MKHLFLADVGGVLWILALAIAVIFFLVLAAGFVYATLIRKVRKGTSLVRTGLGGTQVSFNSMWVVPLFHRVEEMDISVKRIEIDRSGHNGLICKDNMRADIKVVFFVRVNNADKDVLKVAEAIGCARASSETEIRNLFDAKFSEALKTVGKRFDFTELYEERDTFRNEIVKVIGTDLNGFVLDDCAIDHLEQTTLESLDPENILDAQGIKKITELTAIQAKLTNEIIREKEKVLKQQDVAAREAVLELERQQSEAEAKQHREVSTVRAREQAESLKVQEEERLKAERARLAADEQIAITKQNMEREVLVAQRSKERTDAVEVERVKRDQEIEAIERERLTTLKSIEKEKAVEIERKGIQDVIKDRVMVEKTVVEEQEKIKDTEAFAAADREKKVALTQAERAAQEDLIRKIKEAEAEKEATQLRADMELYERVKLAEADRKAAELRSEETVILAQAEQAAAEKRSAAKKLLAEGTTAEAAATGLGEAQVIAATPEAEARGIAAKGEAEAKSKGALASAEAGGINAKAEAMKKYNDAGKDHEEFKLNLEKSKAIELAEIQARADIAGRHSEIVAKALGTAKIDIIGGETTFFDRITQAVGNARAVDRLVGESTTLSDIKETFFNGDPEYFKAQLARLVDQFGLTSEDLKNLTVSAMLTRLIADSEDESLTNRLVSLLGGAKRAGLATQVAGKLLK